MDASIDEGSKKLSAQFENQMLQFAVRTVAIRSTRKSHDHKRSRTRHLCKSVVAYMIDTELLDVINKGDAWLFVGSGVSTEAGFPTWDNLITLTLLELSDADREKIQSDNPFQRFLKHSDFPGCFQRIENYVGKTQMKSAVVQVISQNPSQPGELARLLADWPVAGYLTTNYDHLLESAVEENGQLGWISIGNQPEEVKQVSGDVRNIVWHLHGSAFMNADRSTLVVTTSDYDQFYLENSHLQQQLKSFLTHRRMIFIGFGFRDPELMRILKIVERYTVPERPIYAFLGTGEDSPDRDELRELRETYNVEVKPYRVLEGSHEDLLDQLKLYSSMVVKRSISYGTITGSPPSYDADTTGLLIYNNLVLTAKTDVVGDKLTSLLSARVLSVVDSRGTVTIDEMCSDVGRLAFGPPTDDTAEGNAYFQQIVAVIEQLQDQGYILRSGQEADQKIRLTASGRSFVDERAGIANRIRAQFKASVLARAKEFTDGDATHEVADAATAFLEESVEQRSLGVAMVLNAPNGNAREFQVVALLQNLPDFFPRLSDVASARALIKVVQGILSSPSDAEAKHYGLLLQARLGVHLLGVDQNTLRSRIEALKDTVFILDSSSLIPLLAVSGTGHKAAVELLRRINLLGARPVTTRNLVVEVSEHAYYAVRTANNNGGWPNTRVLDSLMGRDGARANVFLSGFAEENASGSVIGLDFSAYLQRTCGFSGTRITDADCSRLIGTHNIPTLQLSEVSGFEELDLVEAEDLYTQIESRRVQSHSFRHERQVRAEAEAVVLVQKFRQGEYTIDDRSFDGSFFVSNSRFIDNLSRIGLPITMRDNVLLQLLGTLTPFEESELPVLMDGLLWELTERDIDFVDRRRLRSAFSGTISAAKEEYDQVVARHKELIANELGVDPERAFQDVVDELAFPSLVPQHYKQLADRSERELKRARSAIATTQSDASLSQSDRTELVKLRSEKSTRVQKNRRRANRNRIERKKSRNK